MRKMKTVAMVGIVVFGATMMYAQASRTWVSGVGDDANPCSRTAPCKTFAGAISKTAAGGEIDALDPGGFGALTITKAITLDGGGGQVASVLVAGTNGIVVAAGANDVTIIRNLRINGIAGSGNGGLNGIRFLSGRDLNVENGYVFGFTQNGLDIALNQNTQGSVHVLNSVFKNNAGVGIRATNAQTPAVQLQISNTAVLVSGTIGVESAQHSRTTVTTSVISSSGTDGLKADDSTTNDASMSVDHSDVSFNNNGITSGPGTVFVSSGDNKVAFSGNCGLNAAGGSLFTFTLGANGTNRLWGNTSNTCGTISPLVQQ